MIEWWLAVAACPVAWSEKSEVAGQQGRYWVVVGGGVDGNRECMS